MLFLHIIGISPDPARVHNYTLPTDVTKLRQFLGNFAKVSAPLHAEGCEGLLTPISRTLHKHEQNYLITELETLDLVWAVKYFRAYLLGHHLLHFTPE